MRLMTLAIVAMLGVPVVAALPGIHVTSPTSEASTLGIAAEAAGVQVGTGLLALPGASVANPLAQAGIGPDSISTTAAAATVDATSGRPAVTAADASYQLPLMLLPDGALFIGAGTYRDDTGFGARFADTILTLHRETGAFTALGPRAPAAAATEPTRDTTAGPHPLLTRSEPTPIDATERAPAPRDERSESLVQTTAPVTTTGLTATTAAVAAGVGLSLLALLGFALYHRIRPHATLDNDTRKTIFATVCENPGVGVQDVAKVANVSYSTATYHLERLAEAGMIVMTPDGNKLCYYKNGGSFTEAERRILPILKNAEAARVLEAIVQAPGTYRSELAQRLGVTTTTINWHLRRLRDAGLVDENRQGRSAFLYPSPDGTGSLAALACKLGESDPDALQVALRCGASSSMASASGAS